MSVLDLHHSGSALLIRSSARLESALSVLDFATVGPSISARGVARLGNEAYIHGKLKFADDTYLESVTGAIQIVVTNQKALSLTDSGGVLHGTWMADTVVAVSDRRLKDNIKPLVSTLQKNYDALHAPPPSDGTSAPAAQATPAAPGDGGGGRDNQTAPKKDTPALSWVLRQLRPVSYNFRKGSEAKNMRFGFIADEMERVLPQVVRELPAEASGPGPKKKGIVYPDLIAVLTAMMRDFGSQMKVMQARVRNAELELDRLDEEDPMNFTATGEAEGVSL